MTKLQEPPAPPRLTTENTMEPQVAPELREAMREARELRQLNEEILEQFRLDRGSFYASVGKRKYAEWLKRNGTP